MSIPIGMMPGQGGPSPATAGGPLGMGGPPGGGQPPEEGGPEQMLQLLTQLQQSPAQSGEAALFKQAAESVKAAQSVVGLLYSRVSARSAKASKSVGECLPKLSECLAKLQSGQETLDMEPSRPMSAPPDLGGGMGVGGPSPTQPMPGF